ncbi:toxin [Thermoactinomyces sp. DSM 45891]|uniref:hypothetical protein n=1 Tax=Thermoactinomyces sp. DSM 45891 TaxID=1761907 RepID=UPI000923A82B|nr:hypothetical protein [Thermoactinomyces sp. DSM 45891]SFX51285.1 toxin [Thermoactinomyces sp. DSM 45891]
MTCRSRGRNRILGAIPIIGRNDSSYQYNYIYALDASLIEEAASLAAGFNGAINPLTLQFDLNKAIQIANDQHMTTQAQLDKTVISQTIQVDNMVGKIMQAISQELNATFPEGQIANQLTLAMTNVFTNLNMQDSSAWIFWKDEGAHSTTYLYNMLFAIQSGDIPDCIGCFPMGFEISVDIEKEKVLFITIKDEHTYSVRVTAIKAIQNSCFPFN